jgi:acid phosphatase family membrane protein YuiD
MLRTPTSVAASTRFDNYIIEIRPTAAATVQAGIVVRDGRGFRFFAATHAFNPLEGHLFKNPQEAERAALRHVTGTGGQGRATPPAH